MDDGTGVISCHVKKNNPELEKIEQFRLAFQNDSSIMVSITSCIYTLLFIATAYFSANF